MNILDMKRKLLPMSGYQMGGGGSGGGAPNTTYSQTSNIPEYAQPYVEQMLGAAQGEIFDRDAAGNPTNIKPYKPFSNDPNAYFAGFSPLQKQAQQQAQSMQVTPETGMASGMSAAAGMGALGTQYNPMGAYAQQFGQQQADQYMNPYMQSVVNIQQQAAQRQADIARTGRNAQATQAGAFGGARQFITDAEANRALADQQNAIQAQGLNTAFSQAQQQFNADQAANLQAQQANIGQQQFGAGLGLQGLQTANQAAQNLANIGQTQYGQNMGILGMQNQFGGQQQQQVQNVMNNQYQDYLNAQNYPYKQLGFMSDMLRGLPLTQQATAMYGQAPSMVSQVAGLGGAAITGAKLFGAKGGATGDLESRPAGLADLAIYQMGQD